MHPFTRQVLGHATNDPYLMAAALGGGTTTIAGAVDLATGPEHIFNSGEFIENGLIAQSVPMLGMLGGMAVGGLGHAGRARMRGRYPGAAANQTIDMKQTKGGGFNADRDFRYTEQINPAHMGRDMAIGGAIGSTAAAFPAIGYMMNDSDSREPIQSLGQSLSMKDKNELNALLDTHSSGPAF